MSRDSSILLNEAEQLLHLSAAENCNNTKKRPDEVPPLTVHCRPGSIIETTSNGYLNSTTVQHIPREGQISSKDFKEGKAISKKVGDVHLNEAAASSKIKMHLASPNYTESNKVNMKLENSLTFNPTIGCAKLPVEGPVEMSTLSHKALDDRKHELFYLPNKPQNIKTDMKTVGISLQNPICSSKGMKEKNILKRLKNEKTPKNKKTNVQFYNSLKCEQALDALQIYGEHSFTEENALHQTTEDEKGSQSKKTNETHSKNDKACVITNEYFGMGFDDCVLGDDTLEQALKTLELPDLLDDLDADLDKVKKEEKCKTEHAEYFNDKVNKTFKKLSSKFHPDRIKNRGGSDADIAKSTEMQKVMNSVWTVLKMLHSNVISDGFLSDRDFRYSICSKVEINILNNEERLKNINNKILIELSWLSRIKHEEIIPYLNRFLDHSRSCLNYFITRDEGGFWREREETFLSFRMCLSGYERYYEALQSLMDDCYSDKELGYIKRSTEEMLVRARKHLAVLKSLNKNCDYRKILHYKQRFQLAEREMVLPFIEYLDLISMCFTIKNYGKDWIAKLKNTFLGDRDVDDNNLYTDYVLKYLTPKITEELVNSDLLHHCVNFCYHDDDESQLLANQILRESAIYIKLSREVAKGLCWTLIIKRLDALGKKFHPIRASKIYSLGECVKDVKKLLEVFQSEYEKSSKEIQELKEEKKRMTEEFKKVDQKLQDDVKELEENEKRLREMLGKLWGNTKPPSEASTSENSRI